MDLDHDACYRAIFDTGCPVRRPAVCGREDDRHLLPADLSGTHAEIRERLRSLPSAAAAQEAGFRPCLRCRPEISPELAFWRGTSNTVSRALALIESGGFDARTMSRGSPTGLALARGNCGVLFRQHVGASPIAVAQTRRVLLAKQLIHETGLSMAEVALAAGFGSVRRLNETFHDLFGRPPGGGCARSRENKARRSGDALSVRLAYRPPYDWEAMLAFLGARAIPGVELVFTRELPAQHRLTESTRAS